MATDTIDSAAGSAADSAAIKESNGGLLWKNFPLETRELIVNGESQWFNFLVIDRPEKWATATEHRHDFIFRSRAATTGLRMNLRGLSYSEWEDIEFEFPLVQTPDNIDELTVSAKNTYKEQQEQINVSRQILALEISTGKKIPGESFKDKLDFISKLAMGETDAFFNRLLNFYSAATSGNDLANYRRISESQKPKDEIEFTGFEDWLSMSGQGTAFHWQHPFEDFILEFPMNKLTQDQHTEICKQTEAPPPPERPGKNPVTGKLDPKFPIRALTDKKWLRATRQAGDRRIVALLDAVLPFKTPGDTEEEKIKWVGSHLLGDVLALSEFLNLEIRSYRNRFDFFTNS